MTRYYFLLLFSVSTLYLHAQTTSVDTTTVYWVADQNPEFPGGIAALKTYILEKLWQPKTTKCELKSDLTIYIKFIVETDGKITQPEVLKSTFACDECKTKAINLVAAMPLWKPAVLNNKTVRYYFILPVEFSATK